MLFRSAGVGLRRLRARLPGLLGRQPALMRFDFAAMADGDEHLAALGLGRLFIFPRMEILPRLHDLDIGPARFDQRIASGGNGRVLRAPELIAVGEIAVLAEQVGYDPTLVFVQWKNRGLGRYRRTPDKPP